MGLDSGRSRRRKDQNRWASGAQKYTIGSTRSAAANTRRTKIAKNSPDRCKTNARSETGVAVMQMSSFEGSPEQTHTSQFYRDGGGRLQRIGQGDGKTPFSWIECSTGAGLLLGRTQGLKRGVLLGRLGKTDAMML